MLQTLTNACTFVGSAITGPIGKECANLWARIASAANVIV
jgi:ribosomal protein L14